MLFGSYRRGDANDPEVYVRSIAAVLARYHTDLVREVTDPNTGIQTTEKYMTFMPNAGELKVYCEGIAARRERMKRYSELPRSAPVAFIEPPEPQPGDKANLFVPDTHPRYRKLVDWSATADRVLWKFGKSSDGRNGIWVAWHIFEEGQRIGKTLADAAKNITQPKQEAAE